MDKYSYDVIFNGKSAKAAGLIFQSPLEISAPEPEVTTVTVPGRNGDLHIYDGSFKNRTAYLRGCMYDPDGVKGAFTDLNEWLFANQGYCTLETSDDPDTYMMARVVNGSDVIARANVMAPINIKFDCKPQRYLNSGNEAVKVQASTVTLFNPTVFVSKPLLKIYFSISSGNGYISWNGSEIKVSTQKAANSGGYIFYDAELDHAYYGGLYFDNVVTYTNPIELTSGDNKVFLKSGDVTSVEIIPRWWAL